jgi:hypothetical protein
MARRDEANRRSTPAAPRPESVELPTGGPEEAGFPVAPIRPPAGERGLSVAAILVVILIGFAVAKPWADPAVESERQPPVARPRPAPTPAGPATPGPTADTAADLAAPICLGAGAWRIASLETWQDTDVRVWRAIEPIAEASGPLDPAIPTAPAVGLEIRALGWCAPAFGPARPVGPAVVETWIVIDGVARHLELRQVLPEAGTTYLGGLYVPVGPCPIDASCPPAATRDVPQPWTSGRIVFRFEDVGAGTTAWFGADAMLSELVPRTP